MSNPSNSTLSVAAILAESATNHADSVALVMGDQEITYATLWEETKAYAGALRARGIGPGDAVAVLLPNVPDFARCYYGILALGATVVPVHALLKGREIEYILRDSGAKLLLVGAPLLAEGARAPPARASTRSRCCCPTTRSTTSRSPASRTRRRPRSLSTPTSRSTRRRPRRSSTRAARPASPRARSGATSRSSSRSARSSSTRCRSTRTT
ncbi:hypothetical protein GCM10025865_15100 [Paraoerskovia sediminicola]|uniref:AMP-dependent synthetase/ligase domain-containing protein n=1 Tax=Paraoerskovia sediminicola TaxID=1138587 RepID=A0ABM8G2C6_9CELL|nr:hypothetical protein GCM10025865_15100 [Paraoerskovia sediminicola]